MNTGLRKNAKNGFDKDFFKLLINTVFGETMGKMRKNKSIKLVTTKGRRNYLVSKTYQHTTKFFYRKFTGYRNGKKL